jgi:dipeptidyl aminopeptidase/acylaminoacyl peptidase
VNYGGSQGYGREYRNRLRGNWGVTDVADCCNGAKYVGERGWADADRLCIDGGSAGGFTTLACLAFRDVFSAGCSLYGVSDLEALASDTHKFESRYLDGLVGPYPESKQVYYDRSPVNHVGKFTAPILLLQGDEDKIVPPNQSELIFDAVRAQKLPTAMIMFEGEQHGFRKAKNIERALEAELYFYSKVFGFELHQGVDQDPIEPFVIENLQPSKM